MKQRKLLIVDVEEKAPIPIAPAVKAEMEKIAKLTGDALQAYGRQLDNVNKARAWLMDRRNWFKGQMWIVRWDGLIPTVCENHGEKLYSEPWDNGLPETVVIGQVRRRESGRDIEEDPVVE